VDRPLSLPTDQGPGLNGWIDRHLQPRRGCIPAGRPGGELFSDMSSPDKTRRLSSKRDQYQQTVFPSITWIRPSRTAGIKGNPANSARSASEKGYGSSGKRITSGISPATSLSDI